jgi:hypothetical protein
MSVEGQNPNLPRRSIAVRFTFNKQTPDRRGSIRRYVPILLQKSFCIRDQNFFWLYTRLSCKYVGDLIA